MHFLYKGRRKALASALLIAFPLISVGAEVTSTDGVETMSEVEVKAEADQELASEVTESYSVRRSGTATRLNTSLKETPQSISVVTRQQLDDFRVLTINDAFDYMTGVKVERVETDRTYYTARGSDITNFQIDGIGVPMSDGLTIGDIDLAVYDRLEVLRGANGLLTGTGNPSATINFIRKKPTADFQAKIDTALGSWNNRRLDADFSGALNESGSVRGRLVLAHQNTDSHLDRYSKEKHVAYGVIEADVTDNATFTVGHTFNQNDSSSNMWGSLPLLYSDGSKRSYKRSDSTAPDWSFWDVKRNVTFAEFEYSFANEWDLTARLTREEMDSDARLFYVFGSEDRVTGLGLGAFPAEYLTTDKSLIANIYANGPFDLFGREHELVVGANWSRTQHNEIENTGANVTLASFGSIEDAPKPAVFVLSGIGRSANFSFKRSNFFTAVKLNATDALKLTAGASALAYRAKGYSYGTENKAADHNKVTPYIGAVYDLNDNHALYASYTSIYNPQNAIDQEFEILDPLEGKNYEVGFKSEWFNKRLNTSFALFKSVQENLAQTIGLIGTREISEGIEAKTKGYEFDVSGEVSDNLSINAGYTRLVSVKDDEGDNVKAYTPRQMAHLTTVYKVPYIQGLKIGGSLNWQSDTHAVINGARYKQNSYATLNLMANYTINNHWSAAVNLYNVTDKKYLTSLQWASFGQGYYAAPFNGLATLTWKY